MPSGMICPSYADYVYYGYYGCYEYCEWRLNLLPKEARKRPKKKK